jgi:glycerophosphoryl diester phosphodiesterase
MQNRRQQLDESTSRVAKCPLLLGHRGMRPRGLRRLLPWSPAENSLPAFQWALSRGCDGFELDVHSTRDGRSVVWHDPVWKGRIIATTDYASLLGPNGAKLACLEDVLRQFGHQAYIDIELKVLVSEETVAAGLKTYPPQCGFIVSSFLPNVLERLHKVDSQIPLGYICDKVGIHLWRELPIKVLLPRHDLIEPQLIAAAQGQGLQIMTWTVNSPGRMRQLANWGVDGLISDYPELLYQTFHSD